MSRATPWWMSLACAAAALLGVAVGLVATPSAEAGGGDPVRGEQVYARCLACHSLDRDRTGPRHCGVVGRRAGTLPGFTFSPAMKASGLTWTPSTLDRFLADPMGVVPGTAMTFAGVPDARDRADLIAWLVVAGNDPGLCGASAQGLTTGEHLR
jgi:cytochrome c